MNWVIRLDVQIKFRAFGITFADVHEHRDFPAPAALVVAEGAQEHVFGAYANHGVAITVALVKA